MTFIRYLARNVSILNVLLAGAVFAILSYALYPLSTVKVTYKPKATHATQEGATPSARPAKAPSPSDYTVIVENNVFHPERKIPPEKKEEKELPKPELTLYGTMITEDLQLAYVDDKKSPYTTPGRGKRPRVLKKGDVIGGFVLKQVEPNRITLMRNEETMTVSLDTVKAREEIARPQAPAQTPQRPTPVQTPQRTAPTPVTPRPLAAQAGAGLVTGGTASSPQQVPVPPQVQRPIRPFTRQ